MIKNINLRGLKTYFLEYHPEGKEILFFIHGFPDTPHAWKRQIDFFKNNYHILCPYLRGSEPEKIIQSKDRFSLEATLLDFLELIKTIDPSHQKKIHILCHDIGGPLGWELAALLGERCHSIIAINAPSFQMLKDQMKNPFQIKKSSYIGFFQIPYLSNWLTRDFLFDLLGKFTPLPEKRPPFFNQMIFYYRQGFRILLFQKKFPQFHKKALVIWANEDPFLEIPTLKSIQKTSPCAQIKVLRGGHWVHQTEYDKVNLLIERFFSNLKTKEPYASP